MSVAGQELELWKETNELIDYEEEEVRVAGQKFLIQSLPEQLPLEVLSKLVDANVEISGRCPWPGSLLLATYLAKSSDRVLHVTGKRVIELGAGSGILGLALSKWCEHIVLTDADPFALNLINVNVEKNLSVESNTIVRKLRWGEAEDIENCSIGGSFDVVLAADVCYKLEIVAPLVQTCAQLAPVFVLCHVPRHGVTHDFVTKEASKAGYELKECITVDEALIAMAPDGVNEGVGCVDGKIFVFHRTQ